MKSIMPAGELVKRINNEYIEAKSKLNLEENMSVVKHKIIEEIALIEISNPPVNAISAAVRVGLLETIENLSLNEKIKAIVITAPERTFLAGADIKEFGKKVDAPI